MHQDSFVHRRLAENPAVFWTFYLAPILDENTKARIPERSPGLFLRLARIRDATVEADESSGRLATNRMLGLVNQVR
jgi:hypothetical protein